MSVIDNLNKINDCKEDIKKAIEDKGVDMTDTPLSGYPEKIGEIQTGAQTESLYVDKNGIYTSPEGIAYDTIEVNVPQEVEGFSVKDVLQTGFNISNIEDMTITEVRSNALENNGTLNTLVLPNCNIIGQSAFKNCVNLRAISLNNCSKIYTAAFSGCSSLSSLYLPNLIDVGYYAFNQTGLKTVELPKCEKVYSSAFYQCRSLTDVSLPICSEIGIGAFESCGVLSEVNFPNCFRIYDSAFVNCSNLERISFPNCYSVSPGAFYGCSKLTDISLPNVISMSGIVFRYCSAITSATIPTFVTGGAAFADNNNLTRVEFPNVLSVSSYYGNHLVTDCPNLTELYLGTQVYGMLPYSLAGVLRTKLNSGVGSIYVNKFEYDKYITASGWSSLASMIVGVGDDTPMLSMDGGLVYGNTSGIFRNFISYLSTTKTNVECISLPNCTAIVGNNAFRDCTNLISVSLPNVRYIGCSAFNYCINITSMTFPNCCWVENDAFNGCSNLTNLDLYSCSYIDYAAFFRCSKLNLTLRYDSVCSAEFPIFNYPSYNIKIFVPASLVESYKTTTGWNQMSSQIFPIED